MAASRPHHVYIYDPENAAGAHPHPPTRTARLAQRYPGATFSFHVNRGELLDSLTAADSAKRYSLLIEAAPYRADLQPARLVSRAAGVARNFIDIAVTRQLEVGTITCRAGSDAAARQSADYMAGPAAETGGPSRPLQNSFPTAPETEHGLLWQTPVHILNYNCKPATLPAPIVPPAVVLNRPKPAPSAHHLYVVNMDNVPPA